MEHSLDIHDYSTAFVLNALESKEAEDLLSEIEKAAKKGGSAVTHIYKDLAALAAYKPPSGFNINDMLALPIIGVPGGLLVKAAMNGPAINGTLSTVYQGVLRKLAGEAATASQSSAAAAEGIELEEIAGEIATSGGFAIGDAAAAVVSALNPITLILAAVGGCLVPVMLKPEKQTHFIVNKSSFAFHFRPSSDLYNKHGKTTVIPGTKSEHGDFTLPRSDQDTGNPYCYLFSFSKDKDAGYGTTGAYQLEPLGDSSTSDLPVGLKIYYDQPTGWFTHNGIATTINNDKGLVDVFNHYDGEDSKKTDSTHNVHAQVHGALDSRTGTNNFAIILIEDA